MSLFIRVQTNFWTHRKTMRLRSVLGDAALWLPVRLWSYAAENQPDGCFDQYTAPELAMLLGYNGDAQAMLEALQQASFLDGMQIHDWDAHNGYHEKYAARAKKAAEARWRGQERKKIGEDKKGQERKGDKHCLTKPQAMLVASPAAREGLALKVGALFGRRPATPFSAKEAKAWAAIQPISEEDFAAIERYYTQPLPPEKDYRRRDLLTLLNNWQGEVDRARNGKMVVGPPMTEADKAREAHKARCYPENIHVKITKASELPPSPPMPVDDRIPNF